MKRQLKHDRAHARRLDLAAPAKTGKRGQVECPKCGAWTKNVARGHRSPLGSTCRGERAVELDELPDVDIPPEPKGPLKRTPKVRTAPIGPRAYGECETCGAFVSGERRYCGTCAANRGRAGR